IEGPVLLKLGDNISTDEIMPAGEQVLPYRSNIPAISKFVFAQIDETCYDRAMQYARSGSLIVAGRNYGQGSSREHAAIAPRYLGLKAVIAKSFARIHQQNLLNFGILPLTFVNPADWEKINQNDVLTLSDLREIRRGNQVKVINKTKGETYITEHAMTDRQIEMVLAGSLINLMRERQNHNQ
ncbi:MAG: aconitate hydratase, partial [Candidatus Binatia bacterium]